MRIKPFSKDEIDTVRKTWRRIEPQNEHATRVFYDNLFAAKPEYEALFKREKSHTITEAIKYLVDGMDNLPTLLPYVRKLAVAHVHFGVREEDYSVAGPVFIGTLKQLIGPEFSKEDEIVWQSVYCVLSRLMISYAYPRPHTKILHWVLAKFPMRQVA